MTEDKFIEMNIDDALIEKPHLLVIEVEGERERHLYIQPVTLGKMYMLKRHMENLEIDMQAIAANPYAEAIRLVDTKRGEVCRIIAYHTLKKKRDIFDQKLVNETAETIAAGSSDEDLASLMVYLLSRDDVEGFMRYLGITKEKDRLMAVIRKKDDARGSKNSYSFGGKSVYGTLIDVACERYGWDYDYVVWGISMVNLRLMLADRIQDVYLTDEEKKRVPATLLAGDEDTIRVNKENMDRILSMDWS